MGSNFNINNIKVSDERKSICKSCPTHNFIREGSRCLLTAKKVNEIVKLKTEVCPDNNWKQ